MVVTRALVLCPDMYTLSPWACDPWALGVALKLGVYISGRALVPVLQLLNVANTIERLHYSAGLDPIVMFTWTNHSYLQAIAIYSIQYIKGINFAPNYN